MDNIIPAEYIPPEVWEGVFDKLEFLERKNLDIERLLRCDRYCCYRTCTKFRNILEPTKRIWLFSEVVPVLAPYISGSTLLTCRGVCKTWKLGVETYLENYELYWSAQKYKKWKRQPTKALLCSFSHIVKIDEFLCEFEHYTENPFPGRNIEIFYDNRSTQRPDSFWNSFVTPLLTRFGHHVYHLRLDLRHEADAVSRLKSLLLLTPNLRTLYLKCRIINSSFKMFGGDFPQLRNLTSLRLLSTSSSNARVPNPFPVNLQWNIVSCVTSQLKILQINFVDLPKSIGLLRNLYLPNLEDLDITITCMKQLDLIFPVTTHHFCLKCINITLVKCSSNKKAFTLANLLQPVKNFRWSLERLAITTSTKKPANIALVRNQDLEALVLFEKIKYLNLKGFDFGGTRILPSLPKCLERLELSSSYQFDWTGWTGVSLDIPGLESQQSRQSMWTKLSRLQKLVLHDSYVECKYEYCKNYMGIVDVLASKDDKKLVKIYEFDISSGLTYTDLTMEDTIPKSLIIVLVMITVTALYLILLMTVIIL